MGEFYHIIKTGLEEATAYERGEIELETHILCNDGKESTDVYPAILEYAADGISVSYPDLPGCLTCGDNDAEALHMAKDALRGHLSVLRKLPKPTPLVDVKLEPNQSSVLVSAT